LSTSASGVSPNTIQHDSQFIVDTAQRLPDEHLAMTPSSDWPMREALRDGPGGCLMCGGPRPSPRARYCTRACQQRSYRLRHQTPTLDLSSVLKAIQRRKALVAHTIYECGACGERFLGERRCGDCNVFTRAVGVGGVCPECDTTVLIDALLGEEVVPTT
jgi:NAD-dependent dihydropyrimidine dehydrogenase PreA subunit